MYQLQAYTVGRFSRPCACEFVIGIHDQPSRIGNPYVNRTIRPSTVKESSIARRLFLAESGLAMDRSG